MPILPYRVSLSRQESVSVRQTREPSQLKEEVVFPLSLFLTHTHTYVFHCICSLFYHVNLICQQQMWLKIHFQ